MANVYLGTDPRTYGEWHTSKFDKRQYCGSCEEFLPLTKIKELPSICTILRERTVLLVVVQTLEAYRQSLADTQEQMFIDETSHREIYFQNLVIIVEEDELFKLVPCHVM